MAFMMSIIFRISSLSVLFFSFLFSFFFFFFFGGGGGGGGVLISPVPILAPDYSIISNAPFYIPCYPGNALG